MSIAQIFTIFGRNRSRRPDLVFRKFLRGRKMFRGDEIRDDERTNEGMDERTNVCPGTPVRRYPFAKGLEKSIKIEGSRQYF